MAEIFTLSGAPVVELMGFGAAPPQTDIDCAQKVRVPVIMASVSAVASVGVGLFGTYKLLKGKGATGIVALLGAGFLFFAGNRLVAAAGQSFEECRKG